jgi:predicted AAA+ superfamily ATPase
LKGLQPDESVQFFKKQRSVPEILKYLLVFGGVPKYLEEINLNASFNQNMNLLCFSKDGPMTKELDRIFYSQFREPGLYKRIAILLKENNLSLNDIAKALKMPSGGGLKSYLQNLEDAEIIKSYVPFDRPLSSKFKKYALSDEYIVFFFKYIEPNMRVIEHSHSRNLFETLTKNSFESWIGFAFERFCIKHASKIAQKLGFENEMLLAGPYFGRGDRKFQIDIVF